MYMCAIEKGSSSLRCSLRMLARCASAEAAPPQRQAHMYVFIHV